jgi:hypothetical protein
MEYFPSKSVMAPVVAQFTITETPERSSEVSSVARPETCYALTAIMHNKHTNVRIKLFCFIRFVFVNFT